MIDLYVKKGDIRDVLPSNVNSSKLLQELNGRDVKRAIANIFKTRDAHLAKEFVSSRNNLDAMIRSLELNFDYRDFFLPLIGEEDLVRLMAESKPIYQHVIMNSQFNGIIREIKRTGSDLAKRLAKDIPTNIQEYTFSSSLLDSLPKAKGPANRFTEKHNLKGKSLHTTCNIFKLADFGRF